LLCPVSAAVYGKTKDNTQSNISLQAAILHFILFLQNTHLRCPVFVKIPARALFKAVLTQPAAEQHPHIEEKTPTVSSADHLNPEK